VAKLDNESLRRVPKRYIRLAVLRWHPAQTHPTPYVICLSQRAGQNYAPGHHEREDVLREPYGKHDIGRAEWRRWEICLALAAAENPDASRRRNVEDLSRVLSSLDFSELHQKPHQLRIRREIEQEVESVMRGERHQDGCGKKEFEQRRAERCAERARRREKLREWQKALARNLAQNARLADGLKAHAKAAQVRTRWINIDLGLQLLSDEVV
jgi:hypothetical protein